MTDNRFLSRVAHLRPRAWRPLALAILVWAVYANSLNGPFAFDDFHVIPDNPAVRGPADIPSYFVDVAAFSVLPGNRDYRPLFLASMALSWWAGGGATWPFHVASVTLHMGNVLLLYLVLARLFAARRGAADGPGPEPPHIARWGAFAGGALFAVHPLATESVDYISSQSVPLAAFFLLLGLHLFLAVHARSGALSGGGAAWRIAAAAAAYLLALLAKPIAIVLPLLLLIWEIAFNGIWADRAVPLWRDWMRRAVRHLPYAAVTVVYLGIRMMVMPGSVGTGSHSLAERYIHYLTQTKAMVFLYLRHALWPFGLNVDRAFAKVGSILEAEVLAAFAVIAAVALLLVRFRRHGAPVMLVLWFPACLLLTSYVVILGQTVNEHRVYLSLAGLCGVAGYLLMRLAGAFPLAAGDLSVGPRAGRALVASLAVALVAGLGVATHRHNAVWASELALWRSAAKNGGTWRAHMNYALALEDEGRSDEALFEFKEAVRLGPYAFAYLNLGNAQMRRGDTETGIANLRTAVRLWPDSPETRLYLAIGLDRIGAAREAEVEFRRALALRPNYLKAYRLFADFLARRGRREEAIEALRQIVALDPGQSWVAARIARIEQRAPATGNAKDLFAAAFAHQKAGRRAEAIGEYRRLLRAQPDHVQGRFNLAYALRRAGDCAEAVRHFERVLELAPGRAAAHYHLAACYRTLGDSAKAAAHEKAWEGR